MQSFLYRCAELSDDPLRGRTPDYCSASHVSTSLRGEGRREGEEKRGGEEGRRGERGEEKGGKRRGEK